MKESVVNNKNVTDMLQKMMQQGDTFVVDINRMVHYATSPNDPIIIGEKTPKKLYIYSTDINDPDAAIINPLRETAAQDELSMIFYSSLNMILYQWLCRILKMIAGEAYRLSETKEKDVDPNFAPILAQFVADIDEKFLMELDKVCDSGQKDFCNIYYNRRKKTAQFLMGIEDETGDYQKYTKMRKKSWTILTKLVKYILKVPEDKNIKDVYVCSTERIECAQFTTFSSVWIKIWECLDPYLDRFDNHHSNPDVIESLKDHFEKIPVYHECVLWLKQPVVDTKGIKLPENTIPVNQRIQPQQAPSWLPNAPQYPMIQTRPVSTPSWATPQSMNPYGGNTPGYGQPQYMGNPYGIPKPYSRGW